MPQSPYPLVIDFARKIDAASGVGTIGHYYDESAQDLFISDNKLATIVYKVEEGHWKDITEPPQEPSGPIKVGCTVLINDNSNYYDRGVTKEYVYPKDEYGNPVHRRWPNGHIEYTYYIRPLPSNYYNKEWVVYNIVEDPNSESSNWRVTLFGTDDGSLSDKFDVKMGDLSYAKASPQYNPMEKKGLNVEYWKKVEIEVPGSSSISKIRFDHVSNGYLYFTVGNKIYRYNYAFDLSPLLDSWDYSMQSDSPVNQFNSEIMNVAAKIFTDEMTLFQPGSRISVAIRIGKMPLISFGETWLDECVYNVTNGTVSISSRNLSGYFLKDQTLDKSNKYQNMKPEEVLKDILAVGCISDYEIEPIDTTKYSESKDFDINGSTAILDAIDDIISEYDGYMILEDWKNKIYIGSEEWMFEHFPNGNFVFDEGKDLFSRTTTRSADAAFVKVIVTAKNSDGEEGVPLSADVQHYKYWNLGAHKTKHFTAPDGMEGEDLSNYATKKAKELQYTGIKEDLLLSLHPEVLIGDIGTVKSSENEGEGTLLGLVTEITHSFSRNDGWRTNVIIDSGGEHTNRNSSLYNQAASIFGYNRKQSVLDIVKMTKSR